MRDEVLSVVGRQEELTMEHFARMPYLRAVIWESMRYNNPSNVTISRVSDTPLQAGKLVIPPNTSVTLNLCAALHNKLIWDEPSSFNPDRFMKGRHQVDETNWIAFGLGPRQCPARNFSLYEQRVLAVMLLREYRWRIPDDSIHLKGIANAFSPFAVNAPYNMDIIFEKLSTARYVYPVTLEAKADKVRVSQ